MSDPLCDKYLTHQFLCKHLPKLFRCFMKDGCILDYCRDCILDPKSPYHTFDLIDLRLLTKPQLPDSRREWDEIDVLSNLLRLAGRY